MHRQEVAGEMSYSRTWKKAPGDRPRPLGHRTGCGYPPGGFPRPKSSSKTTLISQRQSVAALEQFRGCSRAISVEAQAPKGVVIICAGVSEEGSLREDSRSLFGRESSVVRPDFAECESKNRSS